MKRRKTQWFLDEMAREHGQLNEKWEKKTENAKIKRIAENRRNDRKLLGKKVEIDRKMKMDRQMEMFISPIGCLMAAFFKMSSTSSPSMVTILKFPNII